MHTTLENANRVVREHHEGNWDQTLPASAIRFQDFTTANLNGSDYVLQPQAQSLIARRLRVPAEYLHRCPAHLQETNLNHWLGSLEDTPLFLRMHDHEVRAVFTPRYRPIDNVTIMARIMESFPGSTSVEMFISEKMLSISIPDEESHFKINGDMMVPGASFSNSEIGIHAYRCAVFYQRLACTNGLITASKTDIAIRHIKQNALEDFASNMSLIRSSYRAHEQRMRLSIESKVDCPYASIASFCHTYGHTNNELRIVQEAWQVEPIATMWGIINGFTAAAKSREINHDQAAAFQRTGGSILELLK
jgi:hypothetical protein